MNPFGRKRGGGSGHPDRKSYSWHNLRGDKYMHASRYLRETAASRREQANEAGVGFIRRRSLLRKAEKHVKDANRLANRALYHWNTATRLRSKQAPLRPPSEWNPYHTHRPSSHENRGKNWDDWTHSDYAHQSHIGHGGSGEEFGAEEWSYVAKPNRLPHHETPYNTHYANPNPHTPRQPHAPHSYTSRPYENHEQFEHRNRLGGNIPQHTFQQQEHINQRRATENAHQPGRSTGHHSSPPGWNTGGTGYGRGSHGRHGAHPPGWNTGGTGYGPRAKL